MLERLLERWRQYVEQNKLESMDYSRADLDTQVATTEIQGLRSEQEDRVISGRNANFVKLSSKGREIALKNTVAALQEGVERRENFIAEEGSTLSVVVACKNIIYPVMVGDSTAYYVEKDEKDDKDIPFVRLYTRRHNIADWVQHWKDVQLSKQKLTEQELTEQELPKPELTAQELAEQERFADKIYAVHNKTEEVIKVILDAEHKENKQSEKDITKEYTFYLGNKLQLYRSIGDFHCEQDELTHQPDIKPGKLKILPEKTHFIINACDGLTERLPLPIIKKIVRTIFRKNGKLNKTDFEKWFDKARAEQAFKLTEKLLKTSKPAKDFVLELSRELSAALVASAFMAGSRDNISVQVMPVISDDSEATFVAVFDGHSGPGVSEYLAEHFADVFEAQIQLRLKEEASYQEYGMTVEEAQHYDDLRLEIETICLSFPGKFKHFIRLQKEIENTLKTLQPHPDNKAAFLSGYDKLYQALTSVVESDLKIIKELQKPINQLINSDTQEIKEAEGIVKTLKARMYNMGEKYVKAFEQQLKEEQKGPELVKPLHVVEKAMQKALQDVFSAYIKQNISYKGTTFFNPTNIVNSSYGQWLEARLMAIIPEIEVGKIRTQLADEQQIIKNEVSQADILLRYVGQNFPELVTKAEEDFEKMNAAIIAEQDSQSFINVTILLQRLLPQTKLLESKSLSQIAVCDPTHFVKQAIDKRINLAKKELDRMHAAGILEEERLQYMYVHKTWRKLSAKPPLDEKVLDALASEFVQKKSKTPKP